MNKPAFLLLLAAAALYGDDAIPQVRFHTTLGDIDVTLLPNQAPLTVANFLGYVDKGAYDGSIIHRSVPGFIFQGGGYALQNHSLVSIPQGPTVTNEFNVSNTRGTIAMALKGTDANSATNQWFFNEVDNSSNLNTQNGGFTAFGRVLNDAGLAVMDKIAAVTVPSPSPLASPYDQIPLVNWTSGTAIVDSNYVQVLTIRRLLPFPVIANSGIVTATNFGGYVAVAAGSFMEIYGTNLAPTSLAWAGSDFNNGKAPTSLGGVTVTVAGIPAYVNYVSPGQLNVQVPAGVPTSGTAPVVVTYNNQASNTFTVPMRPYSGGLLAPPAFKVGTTQYVAAFHADGSYVTPGTIPGIKGTPAAAGETIIFYGVGFGPVSPGSTPVAGQIVTEATSLATPAIFSFDGSAGQVQFGGLVQGLVGLYQFNVTLPANVSTGDVAIKVNQGAQVVPQTLFIPVK